MAISTYKVFLMKKGDSDETYSKLCDIKEFPDLGGEPEMLETTTLPTICRPILPVFSPLMALSFTANYDMATFKKLKELEGKEDSYAVWFGGTGTGSAVTPDGSNGKFAFKGQLSVFPVGGGVNEVVNMNISLPRLLPSLSLIPNHNSLTIRRIYHG